jgi:hypothetical protein
MLRHTINCCFLLALFALGGPPARAESVDALSERIIQALKGHSPEDRVVNLVHIRGRKLDPDLKRLVILLDQAKIRVKGTLVSPDDFDQATRDLEPESSAILVPNSENPKKSLWRKIKDAKARLFGTPNGITFVEHFFEERDPSAKSWRERFAWKYREARESFHRLAWQSAAFVGVNLNLSLAYSGTVAPILSGGTEAMLSTGLMATWVYTVTLLQRETMSLKKQGRHVEWDEFKPEGEQLVVRHNKVLFSGLSWAQEVVIGTMMMSIFAAPENLEATDFLNIGINGAVASYSYIPAQMALAKILDQAQDALDRGDQARHDQLIKRYGMWMRIWWWGAYSIIRNLPMLMPAATHGNQWIWASLPLIAAGTVGWALDFVKDNPHALKKQAGRGSCASLLTWK